MVRILSNLIKILLNSVKFGPIRSRCGWTRSTGGQTSVKYERNFAELWQELVKTRSNSTNFRQTLFGTVKFGFHQIFSKYCQMRPNSDKIRSKLTGILSSSVESGKIRSKLGQVRPKFDRTSVAFYQISVEIWTNSPNFVNIQSRSIEIQSNWIGQNSVDFGRIRQNLIRPWSTSVNIWSDLVEIWSNPITFHHNSVKLDQYLVKTRSNSAIFDYSPGARGKNLLPIWVRTLLTYHIVSMPKAEKWRSAIARAGVWLNQSSPSL